MRVPSASKTGDSRGDREFNVEAAEHHAGARLGREERRLLRHAQLRGRGGADRVDADRAQQHRGVGVALLDLGGDGRGVVAVGEAHPGHGREHAGVEARRVDVAQLDRELGHRGRRARRSGASSARPSRSTRPSPPPSRMRGLQRGDALGHVGTCGVHGERAGERGPEIADAASRRRAGEQAVDGAHAELVGGELHDQGHDRVGARIVGPAARRSAR